MLPISPVAKVNNRLQHEVYFTVDVTWRLYGDKVHNFSHLGLRGHLSESHHL